MVGGKGDKKEGGLKFASGHTVFYVLKSTLKVVELGCRKDLRVDGGETEISPGDRKLSFRLLVVKWVLFQVPSFYTTFI